MRKWFGLVMAVALMVGITACSGGDTAPAEDSAPATDAAPSSDTPKEGSGSAQADAPAATADVAMASLDAQTVGVACGVCVYGMEGEGCPIAAKVGDKTYMVELTGDPFDTHGAGLCSADTDAKATVTGEVKDDKLVLSSLELITE